MASYINKLLVKNDFKVMSDFLHELLSKEEGINHEEFIAKLRALSHAFDNSMRDKIQAPAQYCISRMEEGILKKYPLIHADILAYIGYRLINAEGESTVNYIETGKNCLEKARQIAMKDKTGEAKIIVARTHGSLGAYYYRLGDYKNALTQHKIGYKMKDEVLKDEPSSIKKNFWLARSYTNIASDYYHLKRYKESLENHLKAKELLCFPGIKNIDQVKCLIRCLGTLAELIATEENTDLRLRYVKEVISIFISEEKSGMDLLTFEYELKNNQTEFQYCKEHLDKIWKCLNKSLDVQDEVKKQIIKFRIKIREIGVSHMDSVLSCPPIEGDRIEHVKQEIKKWLNTPELLELITMFGGQIPENASLKECVKEYLAFSDIWDYRAKQQKAFDLKIGEGVRWMIKNDELNEEQKDAALTAAYVLGLHGDLPHACNNYQWMLCLGGARMSCLFRMRHALNIVKKLNSPPKAVAMLASMRNIADSEREATDTYAPQAKTEFDLFVTAYEKENAQILDSEERYDDPYNPNNSWIIRKYRADGYEVAIIAAPSSDPLKRRANSADTYHFFFNRFQPAKGSSILLSTSRIYVPYQHMEAIRTIAIPHEIYLDTTGFPVDWNTKMQGMMEPSNYLQEIRSTIQAIDRFLAVYD